MDKKYWIKKKLEDWIFYAENDNHTEKFRKEHDLDCVLTGGNLFADTIFSLWAPLKNVLAYYGHKGYTSRLDSKIAIRDNIDDLLDENEIIVQKLDSLFELGQTIANVMILPDRKMQRRGAPPYLDYVPYFLYECFEGGAFSNYFENDECLIEWIKREHIEMFFKDNQIAKDNILDLADTGDVRSSSFKKMDVEKMLDAYIEVLEKRSKYLNYIQ